MAVSARSRVFLDITVGTEPAGRLTIELFNDQTPKTCENFIALCNGSESDPKLTYALSPFHRVIDDFMIQGGDITKGDGTGGLSIYGDEFEDENLSWRELDSAGLVCMANRGKNTNSSQFFITLEPCPHLNNKHTIFGHLVSGQDALARIAKVAVDKTDRPLEPVLISRCGELQRKKKQSAPAPASRSHERGRKHRRHASSASRSSQSASRSPPRREKRKRRQSDNAIDENIRGRVRARSRSPLQEERDSSPKQKRELSPSPARKEEKRKESRSRSPEESRRRRRRSLPNQYDERDQRNRTGRDDGERDGGESYSGRREERDSGRRYDGRRGERFKRRERDFGDRRERQSYRPPRDGRLDEGRLGSGGTSGGGGADGDSGIKFKGRGSMKYREPDRKW